MDAFGEGRSLNHAEDDGKWKQRKWTPTLEDPVPPARCTSKTEKGTQCTNSVVKGGVRCGAHSTTLDMKSAQARVEAAKLRMIGLVEPAIDVLEELMAPGVNDSVRLKAVENVFDRAGLNKGQDLNVQVEQSNSAARAIEERLLAIRERKEADVKKAEAEAQKEAEEIIEAVEVLDNPAETE